MNRIYSLVWSAARGCFVAAAETTKVNGKKSKPGAGVAGALLCFAIGGAGLLAAGAAQAQVSVTVEAAGVRESTATFSSAAMETFNTQTISNATTLSSVFGSQVGSTTLYTATGSSISPVNISAATNNGGASLNGTGAISGYGRFANNYSNSTFVYPNSTSITVNLGSSVNYFGLDMESVNNGNNVALYSGSTLVYNFSTNDLMNLIGSNNAYKSSNNDFWAYTNFYGTNGVTFDRVVLSGQYFESDNYILGNYSAISGTSVTLSGAMPDIVSANNRTGSSGFNLLSNVAGGSTFNNRFDGGTLKVDSNNASTSAAFSITANKGYIDQNGNTSTFSGVISNDGNAAGRLVIQNSAGSLGSRTGRVILSGVNTYSGGTEVQAGSTLQVASGSALGTGRLDLVGTTTESATLAVTASTTISNNITVAGDPTFDITNGTTTVSGVIADGASAGDVVKTGAGTLVLTAANTYTGPTTVSQGTLTVSGSLSDRTAVTVASGATYNVNASDTIGSLAGAGTVSSSNAGAKVLTAGAANTSTTFSGVIQNGTGALGLAKTGSGTMTLTGVNTYTGPTTISAGTLKLSGSGAIAGSTAVTNNATFDVTQASGNVALGGTYTQGANGTLKMTVAPVSNQQVNAAGTASLGGTLNLASAAGTYRAGRYTLMTSAGLGASSFSAFSTNLASVTNHTYNLAYDANNVYLELRSSAADTMASIQAMGADLNKVYNAQYGIAQLGLSYDCKLFDENNVCLSTGARTTHSRADGSTYDGVALIAAYRAKPDLRVGAWLDQNESRQMSMNVTAGNSTPMFGAFAVWNENPNSAEGLEVKLSAAYGQKDLALTRPVVGTSERGQGNSKLSTMVAEASVGYGIQLNERARISPFTGLRYAKLSNAGYTENADIFSPLTFAKTTQSASSVMAGVNLYDKPEGPIGLDLSAGVERYLSTSAAKLSATGIDGLSDVQMTPVLSKNRPFASASLHYDMAKNQQLLFGLSHSKQFANSAWVTSATVRYVIGL